jgi:hypothetical protein
VGIVPKLSGPIRETAHYELTIGTEPEGKYEVYVIRNKKYGINEAYISSLPRAIQMLESLEHDIVHGAGDSAAQALAEILGGGATDQGNFASPKPPKGGKAN